jgi:GntR family transcriptional regulator
MVMFDKSYPLPIYYQLKELIREKIAEGVWKPGDLLPSERELSEQYGISRMTARQALNELLSEGLVRRIQGRGTFVAELKLIQHLTRLTGYTEDMAKRGLRSGARLLYLEEIEAPDRVAEALQIQPGMLIVFLERLRLAEGTPMAIEASHIHFDGVHQLLDEDFENDSLYRILSEKYDVVPTRAEQQMEAALCNQRWQKLLELQAGAPVLAMRRITFDQLERPFEYTESVYRGDRYVFYIELAACEPA